MRNPEYQFFSLDSERVTQQLIAQWEKIVGTSVQPASPERLFIAWVTDMVIHERAEGNRAANQNLPSRAEGENLDELGVEIFNVERPKPERAVCTVRFWISEAQNQVIAVPAGTRVTDKGGSLVWELPFDLFIQAGELYADAQVRCQGLGVVGNGYAKGQINTLVDLYDYCAKVENITESEGGADAPDDDTYYELMRESTDAVGSGGARGSYIYNAKRASTLIADVVANTSGPATVAIYVLMQDGTPAGPEMKAAVLEACSQDDSRPMTDLVTVVDPEFVDYNIRLTYYIKKDATTSSADIQKAVQAAVEDYATWQSGKLGRDINPEELVDRVRATGNVKRVVLESPSYTALRSGREGPVDPADPHVWPTPQVARLGTVTLKNGGVEDE